MDTRNEILTNVLAVMSSIITGVALDQLQSVLVSELENTRCRSDAQRLW